MNKKWDCSEKARKSKKSFAEASLKYGVFVFFKREGTRSGVSREAYGATRRRACQGQARRRGAWPGAKQIFAAAGGGRKNEAERRAASEASRAPNESNL